MVPNPHGMAERPLLASPARRAVTTTSPALDPTSPETAGQRGNFSHGHSGPSPEALSEMGWSSISSPAGRRDPPGSTPTPAAVSSSAPNAIGIDATVELPEDDSRSQRSAAPRLPCPRHILALPPEILLMILQLLDFADIVRLRKTCKRLRALASPQRVRAIFGPDRLHSQLLRHCKTCLLYDPHGSRLLDCSPADAGYPLASCCLDCAVKARDPRIRMGRKIILANLDTAWLCRWCGHVILGRGAPKWEQMHRACYSRYSRSVSVYLFLGWLQFGLGIVAAALAWKYYRHEILVFAPTVTNFLLFWICLVFVGIRGVVRRVHHWILLVLELVILSLWIPPVYSLALDLVATPGGSAPRSTRATLAIFALNMLFRLLNVLGNIVLLVGFDITTSYRSGISIWKRSVHYLASGLILWTYPRVAEEKYPSHAL
ncbi:hypothetical protein VTH06DRAFT_3956 [Thermothelomyces fergusii]